MKCYNYFNEEQNLLINEDMTHFFTQKQKENILELFKDGIKLKKIADEINEPAFVVKQHLEKAIGEIQADGEYFNLSNSEANYGKQYAIFQDSKKIFKSKWVYSKELDIPTDLLCSWSYRMHHINFPQDTDKVVSQTNKLTDRIENLCLILDDEMHRKVHISGINRLDELEMFVKKYIDEKFQNLADKFKELASTRYSGTAMNKWEVELQNLRLYDNVINIQFEVQKQKMLLDAS